MPVIHWFRRDLRLTDNFALAAACQSGEPVIPLFILDPAILSSTNVGAPRLTFMLKTLHALDETLRKQGGKLVIRNGEPDVVLHQVMQETGATTIYFNRDYTPYARRRDAAILKAVNAQQFDDAALLPPEVIMKADGGPYTVFTPFKRTWLKIPKPPITTAPAQFRFVTDIQTDNLPTPHDLGIESTFAVPEASEAEAMRRLHNFLQKRIYRYRVGRNELAGDPHDDTITGTSFLSPYFRFGLLSPRQAFWSARDAYLAAVDSSGKESVETWVSELVWRDFYLHILYHFPHAAKGNYRQSYDALEWRRAEDELETWKQGQTGYPVVDAAMRQMNQMGWMPNRARMIVASFLTKDLLIHWQEGERYFMQRLIDGDPAANNGGWQWAAGTGTDAQPFFRIFNPVSQSEKFDPDGAYIRRWVSELRDVPKEYIHAPWRMPTPPKGYLPPMVDHAFARQRTLSAFKAVREK
jgi:deoxyribodipyrimidine photo-lyase